MNGHRRPQLSDFGYTALPGADVRWASNVNQIADLEKRGYQRLSDCECDVGHKDVKGAVLPLVALARGEVIPTGEYEARLSDWTKALERAEKKAAKKAKKAEASSPKPDVTPDPEEQQDDADDDLEGAGFTSVPSTEEP